jgi:hypothetical protein
MKTYFCPHCGCGYESSECRGPTRSFRVDMHCPKCNAPVQISGFAFIVLGLIIWFCCSMVLDMTTPLVGAFVGSALGAVGLVRLVRQFLAGRRARML